MAQTSPTPVPTAASGDPTVGYGPPVQYGSSTGLLAPTAAPSGGQADINPEPEEGFSQKFVDRILRSFQNDRYFGQRLILASFILQAIIIILAFVGFHHHTKTPFGWGNFCVILFAVLLLFAQLPYMKQWHSPSAMDFSWHRDNMFVPLLVQVIVLVEFFTGVFALFAHSQGFEIFGSQISNVGGLGKASFILCSITIVPAFFLLVLQAHAHRYLTGPKFNCCNGHINHHASENHPKLWDRGTYKFGHFFLSSSTGLFDYIGERINVRENYGWLCTVTIAFEAVFYIFAAIAFSEGQERGGASIIVIVIATATGIIELYQLQAAWSRSRTSTGWHRSNLLYPVQCGVIMTMVYFIAMMNLFFNESKLKVWDVVIPGLEPGEKAIFSFSVIAIVFFIPITCFLAFFHRKEWKRLSYDKPYPQCLSENLPWVTVEVNGMRFRGILVETELEYKEKQQRAAAPQGTHLGAGPTPAPAGSQGPAPGPSGGSPGPAPGPSGGSPGPAPGPAGGSPGPAPAGYSPGPAPAGYSPVHPQTFFPTATVSATAGPAAVELTAHSGHTQQGAAAPAAVYTSASTGAAATPSPTAAASPAPADATGVPAATTAPTAAVAVAVDATPAEYSPASSPSPAVSSEPVAEEGKRE